MVMVLNSAAHPLESILLILTDTPLHSSNDDILHCEDEYCYILHLPPTKPILVANIDVVG
jgi:hypothetical protein